MKILTFIAVTLLTCFASTPLTQIVCGATLTASVVGPAHQTIVPGSPQGPTIDAAPDDALFLNRYSFYKNILWSPNTLGPVQPGTSFDWTNGYGLPGISPTTAIADRTP